MGVGPHRARDEHLRPLLRPRASPARRSCTASRSTSRTVGTAIDAGLAYVTEDRKSLGLILDDDITHNITLANLRGVSKRGVIDEPRGARRWRSTTASGMNIRTPSVYQKVLNLSGGNQQKVVLSKWLFSGPEVLILDEPTRGIDVGAKYEIYTLINALADQGKGGDHDLLRDARAARHVRPHLRDERRRASSASCRRPRPARRRIMRMIVNG